MDALTRQERGQRIDRKLADLGMSYRAFNKETGVDRDTLVRAIEGDQVMRETTLKRIEAHLERLDEEMGSERDGMPGTVEVHVSEGGRTVTVRGSVGDLAELEASVARLMKRDLSGDK